MRHREFNHSEYKVVVKHDADCKGDATITWSSKGSPQVRGEVTVPAAVFVAIFTHGGLRSDPEQDFLDSITEFVLSLQSDQH